MVSRQRSYFYTGRSDDSGGEWDGNGEEEQCGGPVGKRRTFRRHDSKNWCSDDGSDAFDADHER